MLQVIELEAGLESKKVRLASKFVKKATTSVSIPVSVYVPVPQKKTSKELKKNQASQV